MLKENDLKKLIEHDAEFMGIFIYYRRIKASWLMAMSRSIKNYVWNYLLGEKFNFITDIDVIYYDKNFNHQKDLEIEKELNK